MWKIQITKLKSRVIKCTCCYDQSINQSGSECLNSEVSEFMCCPVAISMFKWTSN